MRARAVAVAAALALAACTPSPSLDGSPSGVDGPASPAASADSPLPPAAPPVVTAAPTAPAAGPVDVPEVTEPEPKPPPEGVVIETARGPVVGDGRPETCTSAALGRAVRMGGLVRFDCGGQATIVIEQTVTVCNTVDCAADGEPLAAVRIDGAREITLAAQGQRPLLYANVCEESLGTLPEPCAGSQTPHLILDGLTLVDGHARGGPAGPDGSLGLEDLGGGAAVAMRGGRLSIVDSLVTGNHCGDGDQASGGGVLVRDMTMAVEIKGSTFAANDCALGGAIAAYHAPLLLAGTSIVDNIATQAGGGIVARGTAEPFGMSLSTVAGNRAPQGAGIDYGAPEGTLTIRDSRVAGNDPDARHNTAFAGIQADAAAVVVERTTTD